MLCAVSYPYSCTEQIASRLIALVAFQDLLASFSDKGLPADAQEVVKQDLALLVERQKDNGGCVQPRVAAIADPCNAVGASGKRTRRMCSRPFTWRMRSLAASPRCVLLQYSLY